LRRGEFVTSVIAGGGGGRSRERGLLLAGAEGS
jgi:hypothetical protein